MSEGARRQNEILQRFSSLEPAEIFKLAMTCSDTEAIDRMLGERGEADDLLMEIQGLQDRVEELEAEIVYLKARLDARDVA